MQTKIIKIDAANIDSTKIKEAAGLIDAGKLVAFPTETVYGIGCRVENKSLAELDKIKGRSPEKCYTLHIADKGEVKKYIPTISFRAQKLIKNAWPGPVTIVFELGDEDIEKQQSSLEREIFENLYYADNSIGIRCPDDKIASQLLQVTRYPVIAPSANAAGKEPAVNAEEVLEYFSGQIDLVIDGGDYRYKKSSTVVKIGKKGMEILREGVYSREKLAKLSEVKFLFVCTGNTCRSPMAYGLFQKYLAEKLQCKVDQLEEKGYKTFSAGTMGIVGAPATLEAITACAAKEIDIQNHKSTALSKQLIEECDFIFTMAQIHYERIIELCPEAANKCVLLAVDKNIPDPIGQQQEVYNKCADMIEDAVKKRINELVI